MLTELPQRPDHRLIWGQHCGGQRQLARRQAATVGQLREQTGRQPWLLGSDLIGGWSPEATALLAAHARTGGLVTICYHAPNPWTGGPSDDRQIGDLAELTTPGTAAYAAWQQTLTAAAGWLRELREAGVVVLWRPFHEMNLPGSHWWASRDRVAFVALWRQMFDRFSRVEGLDNLLWVYSPNAEWTAPTRATRPTAEYYPGGDCVDLVGCDLYTRGPLDLATAGWPALQALGKPLALCEFGPRGPAGEREPPDQTYDYRGLLQQIREQYPELVYVMCWMDSFALARQQGAAEVLVDEWLWRPPPAAGAR
ncbi:MAG: hypothetical protein IT204_14545 [Fimbriimonadaceae bacterium]|nr:hypothetical protein [Fimbriimonadaceae bacterium]